jgi:G8 domain/Cadherin domain/Bacterial Ig domain/K319L-like, PKD domain/PKD domain
MNTPSNRFSVTRLSMRAITLLFLLLCLVTSPARAQLQVLVEEVTTGKAITAVDLVDGVPLYMDTTGRVAQGISLALAVPGAKVVQMASATSDLDYSGPVIDEVTGETDPSQYVRLSLSEPATVYVDVEDVYTHLPDWLGPHHGWALSTESFSSGVVFEKHVPAGSHWLGANDRIIAGFIERTYRVAVAPQAGNGNNPPYAYRDYFDLAGAGSLDVAAANGVTANDTDTNGDTLEVSLVKGASFGEVELNTDGSFVYTPGAAFTRFDSFQYRVNDGQVDGNVTVVSIVNGQPVHGGGHGGSHGSADPRMGEHVEMLKLVPHHAATHIAATSGNWSDASTWVNGKRPMTGANVLIPAGLAVTVDSLIPETLNTVRADGVLRFATAVDTELRADTIVVDATGTFEMGTATTPVAAGVTARVVIADTGPIDTVQDPHQLGRGLIMHGAVSMYGQDVSDFLATVDLPLAGDTELLLAETPVNWEVGDTVVVAGTYKYQSEERTLVAIAGNTITIDSPLVHDRVSPADEFRPHVAHLTRNVQVMSENSHILHRGHTMVMHTNSAEIFHSGFYDLGRTQKQLAPDEPLVMGDGTVLPLSGTNQRARYSVHFHRAGNADPDNPALVTGSVVSGDPGWGYTNHSSNVDFTDNIAYDVDGAGFASEAGDEIGTYRHNLAIHINGHGSDPRDGLGKQNWGVEGDGFWFQGYGVDFYDNVAADLRGNGYATWTKPLQEPGVGFATFPSELLDDPSIANGSPTIGIDAPRLDFDGNTAYGAKRAAYTYHLGGPKLKTTWYNLTGWQIYHTGMEYRYSWDYTENLRLFKRVGDVKKYGIFVSNNGSARHTNAEVRGFEIGIRAPLQGDAFIVGGVLQNLNNIEVDIAGRRNLSIIDVEFQAMPGYEDQTVDIKMGEGPGGSETVQKGTVRKPYNADVIWLDDGQGAITRIWHVEQARDYVPYPEPGFDTNERPAKAIPEEWVGLTNQQLWDQYGQAALGELAPADVFSVPGINGLVNEMPYYLSDGPRPIDVAFTVDDATPPGTAIGVVPANDPTPDDVLSFAIIGGNTGDAFAIDSASGEMTVLNGLHLPTTPTYSVIVEVTDSSSLTSRATVTVNLTTKAPFAHWKLDETAGTTAVDATGFGNHATLVNGPVWDAAGNIDGALVFDGVDDLLDAGDLDKYLHTVTFWVNIPEDVTAATSGTQIARYDDGSQDEIVLGGYSGYATDETLTISEKKSKIYHRTYIRDPISAGWHLIALVWDAENAHYRILIDNEEKTVYASHHKDGGHHTGLMNADALSFGGSFAGTLDDIRLYDYALDTAQLTDLYAPTGTSNNDPVFSADPFSTADAAENMAYSSSIAGSATDIDSGDTLSYTKTSGAAWLNVAANGNLSGTPGSADIGLNSFAVAVFDGNGGTATATLEISVIDVNDPPSAGNAAFAVDENSSAGTSVGVVAASDPDAGDSLGFAIIAGNTGTAFAIDGSGAISVAGSLDYEVTSQYLLTVEVTDSGGLIDSAAVTVDINDVFEAPPNLPPVANAGPDQTVVDSDDNDSEEVTLNGGGSSDSDGPINTYAWSWTGGSASGVNPKVTLPVDTTVITLTVTDDDGAIDTDTVSITVEAAPNLAPTANAGPDQTVVDSDSDGTEDVTLDGSGSSDSDGPITYAWSWGDNTANVVNPTLTLPVGTTDITLTVTDDDDVTDTDTVSITVEAGPDAADPKLAHFIVGEVSTTWTEVVLDEDYDEPVIIATPIYPDGGIVSVVARVQVITGAKSFKVTLARTDGLTDPVIADVALVVVEAGVYTQAQHGVTMEAASFTSTVTAAKRNWAGTVRSYQNSYVAPVVLGQVMSAIDPDWSVFWSQGPSRTTPPDATNLVVGKMVGEDPDKTRADEVIGYLVIESGSGTLDGVPYSAGLGADILKGYQNRPAGYSYPVTDLASASASTAVVTQAAIDGNDGSYAVLVGSAAITPTSLTVVVDEDQAKDSERRHSTEQAAYLVFGVPVPE